MAAPVSIYVLVEAAESTEMLPGGDAVHKDSPMVRFDRTDRMISETDKILIVWPRKDGSIGFNLGPEYVLVHDNRCGLSIRRRRAPT